jgi:hypothetical protein
LPAHLTRLTAAERLARPIIDPREALMAAARQARWSQRVTESSRALDLEPGVFTWQDPRQIARSLQLSAERSRRRKTDAFRSAMSMLIFYINRAGRQLPANRRACLETAKDELRALYGRPRRRAAAKRAAANAGRGRKSAPRSS